MGYSGPTKTMREEIGYYQPETGHADDWVNRISLANNDGSGTITVPYMRVSGEENLPLGGFYVPAGQNLKILLGEKTNGGGWYASDPGSSIANIPRGGSIWITRDDAYNYPDRDPLLLLEQNINTSPDPVNNFEDTTVWFDVSAVDGINANVQLKYSRIDRIIAVPLFESQD